MTNDKKQDKSMETNAGWILLPEQMDALRKNPYLYNASAGSFLELLFLQRFWMWLVKFIPPKVSPCILTCLGLATNLLCCLSLLYYSSDFKSDAPSKVFLLCAIGIFLYQTLDALDGKQAIKVQNTQIEEVYDHGCDAVSTVFVCLTVCAACRFAGCPLLMFLFFLTSMLAFYTTHWQDHITHVMIFSKIDVSEAQIGIMFTHLATAYFGQNIWLIPVIHNIELRHVLGITCLVSFIKVIITNFSYVFGSKTPLDEFVFIPRKEGSRVWNPLIPGLILTTCLIRLFGVGLFELHPCLVMTSCGFAFSKITMKLVMTNVTSADMDIWDSSLLAPLLICLNTFAPLVPFHTSLLCGLIYNFIDLARYFTYISWDMRDALDVWIFALKYPPGHPKCRNGNNGYYLNGLNDSEVKASVNQRNFMTRKIH